jgi:hypothetical protein
MKINISMSNVLGYKYVASIINGSDVATFVTGEAFKSIIADGSLKTSHDLGGNSATNSKDNEAAREARVRQYKLNLVKGIPVMAASP